MAMAVAATWVPSSRFGTVHVSQGRRLAVDAKKTPVDRGAEAPHSNIDIGSICEFHDPKHGSGKAEAVLGICEATGMKAKGGEVITLVDAAGRRHSVAAKAIHIVLPPNKGKAKEPSDILKPFMEVAEKNALALGVDPEAR